MKKLPVIFLALVCLSSSNFNKIESFSAVFFRSNFLRDWTSASLFFFFAI
jgi:hypothetical protein